MCQLANGKLIPIRSLPWWRKDRLGWPIEKIRGGWFTNLLRLAIQNVRKMTG